MKKIILGITGSIAAYKACEIISRLKKKSYEIEVFMTPNSTKFISSLTISSLINKKVYVDEFIEGDHYIPHVNIVKDASCFAIIPATANTIGKIANGIADNTLTSAFLAAKCPKLIAPAMNVNMYDNLATQRNIEKCKMDGINFVDPAYGVLACGDTGRGKLASEDDIVSMIEYCLQPKPLHLKNVLVTAGPTIEEIDPVRYITNHSSGKMGYAIAKAAYNLGANVTLVTGPTSLPTPYGIDVVNVKSAQEMFDTVEQLYQEEDYLICAAAVGDYGPTKKENQKIKKSKSTYKLELTKNPDILAYIGEHKTHQTICGFAMETQDVMSNALTKFEKKNCDLLVVNDLFEAGAGFKNDTNKVTLITKNFNEVKDLMSKDDLGNYIMEKLIKLKGE